MTFLNFKGGHIPLTQTRRGGGLLICRNVRRNIAHLNSRMPLESWEKRGHHVWTDVL